MKDGEKKIAAIPDRMPEKMTGVGQGTRGTQTSLVHNTKGEKYFHFFFHFFSLSHPKLVVSPLQHASHVPVTQQL